MATSEYHRKQAEILAALALTALDRTKAAQFSLLALEHRDLAEKREATPSLSASLPPAGNAKRERA
jgi:hypothetical protein